MASFVLKLLPFLAPLLEKLFPASSREKELQAEKDLAEAKAFAEGRVSPKYLFKFMAAFTFGVMILLTLLTAFFPQAIHMPFRQELLDLIKLGSEIFGE